MNYVKGNILTLITCLIAIAIAIIVQLSVVIAYLLWLAAFMLDASYTFHNRKNLKYEQNVIVKRSRNIVKGFLYVVFIEFAIMIFLSMLLSSDISISVIFVLFAVIHLLAFIRSYCFVKSKYYSK